MSKGKSFNSTRKRKIIQKLLERDGIFCALCDGPLRIELYRVENHNYGWSIDHIVRVADGGTNNIDNLRLTHRKCNSERPVMRFKVVEWEAAKECSNAGQYEPFMEDYHRFLIDTKHNVIVYEDGFEECPEDATLDRGLYPLVQLLNNVAVPG